MTDIAQVLMTWEPDDTSGAIARVTRSIESFGAACARSGLRGAVVIVDGAFDAAWCGGDLPVASDPVLIDQVEAMAHINGVQPVIFAPPSMLGWHCESAKLTTALRIAQAYAPAIIRLDSDETLSNDTDLGAALDAMRGHHGAMVTWDTVGEQAHGSQQVGTKRHLRMFTASPTLTAGPAYHGSYKVHDREWLALRKRGEENAGLASARVVDAGSLVRIVNHPAERSPAMHEAKGRLLAHRYEGAMSDR